MAQSLLISIYQMEKLLANQKWVLITNNLTELIESTNQDEMLNNLSIGA